MKKSLGYKLMVALCITAVLAIVVSFVWFFIKDGKLSGDKSESVNAVGAEDITELTFKEFPGCKPEYKIGEPIKVSSIVEGALSEGNSDNNTGNNAAAVKEDEKQTKKEFVALIKSEIADREETAFINAETETLDLDKYLFIVSESRPVTQDYIDEHFEVIDVVNDRGQDKKVERRAWHFFRKLKEYLEEEEGIIVDLDYGYRSLQDQWDIINEMTEEHGADYAWYYAATPGTSEHHTGLAIDVCLVVDGVVIDENEAMNSQTEIFGRIHRVIQDFGFVLDFPYENWHFRFVGTPEIAKAYYSSGMSFASFADWYRVNH